MWSLIEIAEKYFYFKLHIQEPNEKFHKLSENKKTLDLHTLIQNLWWKAVTNCNYAGNLKSRIRSSIAIAWPL